jgi:hypothetical protein
MSYISITAKTPDNKFNKEYTVPPTQNILQLCNLVAADLGEVIVNF